MAKFEFNIPDGYRPVVENIECCIRPVCKDEYYLHNGKVERWPYAERSYDSVFVLKKIEKPKTYKPFENDEEFEPFADKWISRVNIATGETQKGAFKISGYDEDGVFVDSVTHRSYSEMFRYYTFKDGTPFGINE